MQQRHHNMGPCQRFPANDLALHHSAAVAKPVIVIARAAGFQHATDSNSQTGLRGSGLCWVGARRGDCNAIDQ